jgi:hypothetical protein
MIEPLQVYTDDREFFMQLTDLARAGSTVGSRRQLPDTDSLHAHLSWHRQGNSPSFTASDLWASVSAVVQVFFFDLRRRSVINANCVGKFHPWELLSPLEVGHG